MARPFMRCSLVASVCVTEENGKATNRCHWSDGSSDMAPAVGNDRATNDCSKTGVEVVAVCKCCGCNYAGRTRSYDPLIGGVKSLYHSVSEPEIIFNIPLWLAV